MSLGLKSAAAIAMLFSAMGGGLGSSGCSPSSPYYVPEKERSKEESARRLEAARLKRERKLRKV
jgi:hypothetical protein